MPRLQWRLRAIGRHEEGQPVADPRPARAKRSRSWGYGEHLQRRVGVFWRDQRARAKDSQALSPRSGVLVSAPQGGVWVPGGPPGLQNRRGRASRPGGFDSRPPPPTATMPAPPKCEMTRKPHRDDVHRMIARTDLLLALPAVAAVHARPGDAAARALVQAVRRRARAGESAPGRVQSALMAAVSSRSPSPLRPVADASNGPRDTS